MTLDRSGPQERGGEMIESDLISPSQTKALESVVRKLEERFAE
jgi:hypothetical protein